MNDQTDPPVADEPAADPQADATTPTPPETLEQAQARADSARDQMLRAYADMENLRRRYERELQNATRYGVEALAAEPCAPSGLTSSTTCCQACGPG